MNNFNWEEFKKGNIQVGCKTKESAKDFLSKCAKRNIKWNDDTEIDSKNTYWEYEKENMIYSVWRKSESDVFSKSGRLYYGNTKNQDKQFTEWIIEEKSNTQVELLEDDDGREYIRLQKTIGNRRLDMSFYIDEIDIKESCDDIRAGDIVYFGKRKVSAKFDIVKNKDGFLYKFKYYKIPKQMTKEEIENELGYKIEIIN